MKKIVFPPSKVVEKEGRKLEEEEKQMLQKTRSASGELTITCELLVRFPVFVELEVAQEYRFILI